MSIPAKKTNLDLKNVPNPTRPDDLSRFEDNISESYVTDKQLSDEQKELESFINEADSCVKARKFLDAYLHGNQQVLDEVKYAEISDYLKISGLISETGNVGVLGEKLLKMKRDDTGYQDLCFDSLNSIYDSSGSAIKEIDEIRHTATSGVPVVAVPINNRAVLFLELIGLLNNKVKQPHELEEYYLVSYTNISKTIFQKLNNKISQSFKGQYITIYRKTINLKIIELKILDNSAISFVFLAKSPLIKIGSIVSFSVAFYFILHFVLTFTIDLIQRIFNVITAII